MSKLLRGLQTKGFNIDSLQRDVVLRCQKAGEDWYVYITEDYSHIIRVLRTTPIPLLIVVLTEDEEFSEEDIHLLEGDILGIHVEVEGVVEASVPLSWID